MKLLLLVQSDTDAKAMESAAKAIKSSPVKDIWVVYSPAISVDQSAAASKFDTNIAELLEAEKKSAALGDYTAAAGYKASREEQALDRAKALRDAWKTVPQNERNDRVRALFTPFIETLKTGYNIKISGHQDHFDPDQWVQLLTSLGAAWNPAYTPGSFTVAWPSSLALPVVESVKIPIVGMDVGFKGDVTVTAAAPEAAVKAYREEKAKTPEPPATTVDARRKQLSAMRFFALQSAAKKVFVQTKGKKPEQIVDEVLAAEFPPVAV